MSPSLSSALSPRYRQLLAAPGPDRPWGFFLMERLLQARADSMFPTNGVLPDEDVNVYLAGLLARLLSGDHDPDVLPCAQPLLTPPPCTDATWRRTAFYRANADHRLLYLGLFERGDGRRRHRRMYGMSIAETHRRDLLAGQTCYEAAANHLRPRTPAERALVDIWRKLATHYVDYVHVLGSLATRQLGFGAKLETEALARLLPAAPAAPDDAGAVATLLQSPPPPAAMDAMLDLWLQNRQDPDPATAARLEAMANDLGVQLKP